ncbi:MULTISPECIES: MFS transporter [unclassified Pseudoalteromonas]|uniref:MFS transporter n=1 Tax=unclassified Pseudoalteromonas TaxID=194690 RepID=UPI000C07FC77|nr:MULTISPECIES: MFS transporter [unclassified Pseudoalteromonas]MDP2633219.1 MFS transporter [Pseudoalteromonas sp. 1_MG-2023]PHN91804.1 MFS transporter [Pseudoalteromonas sp. 3D05]
MNNNNNHSLIFRLCCIALIVTSMTFAIRAGILGQLGEQFGLTNTQLGWVNAMAFLGFPIATMLGGIIYNAIGAKKLVALAFACHLLGLLLTISADGFWALLISTFLIGFANGSVEAGCNPLIAQMYPNNKTTMLNRFHVWFPGGIVIGALASSAMSASGFNWQWQVALILIPTAIYGAMMLTAQFPKFDAQQNSTSSNVRNLVSPLYIFLIICMTITAVTEFGTQQWIEQILGSSGASPMVILALITGLMALGRYFAGPIVHRFSPSGVLLGSAVFSTIGIFLMSQAQGSAIYFAAALFAIGVTYFWPTMIGCVAEYTPKTGALGMSLIGGAGMFAMSLWNPVIGYWIDDAKQHAQASNISVEQIEIVAGQAVLENLLIFPIVLIVVFFGFHLFITKQKNVKKCV